MDTKIKWNYFLNKKLIFVYIKKIIIIKKKVSHHDQEALRVIVLREVKSVSE